MLFHRLVTLAHLVGRAPFWRGKLTTRTWAFDDRGLIQSGDAEARIRRADAIDAHKRKYVIYMIVPYSWHNFSVRSFISWHILVDLTRYVSIKTVLDSPSWINNDINQHTFQQRILSPLYYLQNMFVHLNGDNIHIIFFHHYRFKERTENLRNQRRQSQVSSGTDETRPLISSQTGTTRYSAQPTWSLCFYRYILGLLA